MFCDENFALRLQADASQQIRKARVVAQRVELWFDLQKNQKERTVLIRLVQPREGLVFIAQTGIDDGERIRTDVTPL